MWSDATARGAGEPSGPRADETNPGERAALVVSRREALTAGLAMWAWVASGCQTRSVSDASEDSLPSPVRPGTLGQTAAPPVIEPPIPSPTPVPPGGAVLVMPRSAWTTTGVARPALANPMNGIARITVHHEGATVFSASGERDVARRLENVRLGHLARKTDGQPWADIGYHYIVDPAGRVWEGRSTRYQGAHVHLKNEHNLGVMVLGNFQLQSPTPAALATLDRFVAQQMKTYRVGVSNVFTHRELNPTQCPGNNLQAHMVKTRAGGGSLRLALNEIGAGALAEA